MLRGVGIEAGGQQEDGVEIGDGFTLPPLVVEGLCGGEETQAVGVVAVALPLPVWQAMRHNGSNSSSSIGCGILCMVVVFRFIP